MYSFDYHRPASVAEALVLKEAQPDACFIAGGTDVMVRIRSGSRTPPALISLSRIGALGELSVDGPTRIGAMVRVAELARDERIGRLYPSLACAARRLGSEPIRNLATVAGNLCNASPCADLAPPLLVHDARVEITSAGGRRSVPLTDFFLAPGATRVGAAELVSAIELDAPREGSRAIFYKKSRVHMDIALASVAVLVVLEGERCVEAKIAAGSVAPRPMRLRATEGTLGGCVLGDAVIAAARRAAMAEVSPIDDVRTTAAYRRHLVGALVERALRALRDGGEP